MEQSFDYVAEVAALTNDSSAWKRIGRGIWQEVKLEKGNLFGVIASVLLGIAAAVYAASAEGTVSLTEKICDIFLTVQLSVFGCILTVYSIMLALVSDNYVKKMVRIRADSQTSYLRRSIDYYENAMYLYFLAIATSLVLKVLLICLPDTFRLTKYLLVDEMLAGILLTAYFTFSFRTFYEVKSIIGNTALLFRASIAFRIIGFRDENEKVEDEASAK